MLDSLSVERRAALSTTQAVRIAVHGDDFVVEGEAEDLEWVRSVLEAKIHGAGERYHGP